MKFQDLKPGDIFRASEDPKFRHPYIKIAYGQNTHDWQAYYWTGKVHLGCDRCNQKPSEVMVPYVWNALNADGTTVHFCPDSPVYPFSSLKLES
jgi:hypothetical protein